MNFFGQITDTWQALVDLVIRPPRHEYDLVRDLGQRRSAPEPIFLAAVPTRYSCMLTHVAFHPANLSCHSKESVVPVLRGSPRARILDAGEKTEGGSHSRVREWCAGIC